MTTLPIETTIPIERTYSLEDAETSLINELNKLGYQYEFELAGETIYACKCTLTEKSSGKYLHAGNGKGDLAASRVGSLFEATEHLFSSFDFINPNKIIYYNSLDFCAENTKCETLPLALLKNGENVKMPFLEYQRVNGSDRCTYPLALSCPNYIDLLLSNGDFKKKDFFNYERLEHYSSNSGTAIGMTREEAIIHGLLENIERSSLSKFLTKTFLLNKRRHLNIVNPETLPPHLFDVFSRLEKELKSKVLIFEMPNKFGIPAYCSWMEQYEFKIGIAGFGCSLSVENAISRSLYEVGQYFLLGKHIHGFSSLKTLDNNVLLQLEGLPLHQECAKFNLGLKCKELGYRLTNYEDINKLQFSKNTQEYLEQLTDLIYLGGEIPFATELNTIGNEINITHTFITGEDRFFNVRSGKSTFPIDLEND